jgi:hypothetical protein
MKLSRENHNPENYDEMKAFFKKRTDMHVGLVQKYCRKIEDYDPERFKGLCDQAKYHDKSKYEDPEIEPYIYVTWSYRCKDKGEKFEVPDEIDKAMNEATQHHVISNKHHPEYYCGKKVGLINRKDRDKPPSEIVDATSMPVVSIAEMVGDWLAMSEEKGTSCKGWADKNVNIRWKFDDDQKDLIYELIDKIKVDK